jgi:hypothetical protein
MSESQDGGERRRLDRAPGERYAGAAPAPPGLARRRAIVAAAIVADAGALLFFVLGQLDLGVGFLAVAAFAGWATGIALIWWGRDAVVPARLRLALAAFLGGWAIVLGLVLDWGFGLVQGGALGPVDYVLQRFGPWGPLAIAVSALVAAWRAR